MIDVVNIITLERRLDRRQLFMNQCADFKIKYKVWQAVEKEPVYSAISVSHKQIVQYAKDNNHSCCIIAEDDFKFTCSDSFNLFMQNDSSNVDILLGGISGGLVNEETNVVQNFSGLFFYKVHERFYDAFLSADENKQLDRWLGYSGLKEIEKILGRKPVYKVCYPIPVICYDGYSDNSKKVMEHDQYFRAYEQYKG